MIYFKKFMTLIYTKTIITITHTLTEAGEK